MWRLVGALLLGILVLVEGSPSSTDSTTVGTTHALNTSTKPGVVSSTAPIAVSPVVSTAATTSASTATPPTSPPVIAREATGTATTRGSATPSTSGVSTAAAATASDASTSDGTTGNTDAWTTWQPTTSPGRGTGAAAHDTASSSGTAFTASSASSPAPAAPAVAGPPPPPPPPPLSEQHARLSAHGFPSRLLEKLAALSCDIPPLPGESRLWRGNETHELTLPILAGEPSCGSDTTAAGEDSCPPFSVSWEGTAELQAGDVLIVRIDDTRLRAAARPNDIPTERRRPRVFAVAQAQGHERCDTSTSALLDITPLAVEGRHVLTLYDKDLTDGLNLLIVTSELWGGRCVQLRVLVKSDNCGDGQDCSGKGVCFSNTSMDGYECQCCPGYVGPHCEERDACFPSPCRNHGICVDLSQGHEGATYQCLCPYGF